MQTITIIPGTLVANDAQSAVATLSGDAGAQVERGVVYPYYCFGAGCRVPTLVGRKPVETVCLVDAVNGIGATADGFEVEPRRVPARTLIAPTLQTADATRIATRTVTHWLGRSLRTIADFEVALEPRGLVYKHFWIVRANGSRLLLDSTTGGWVPLGLAAA
jgi:hypothetical protein